MSKRKIVECDRCGEMGSEHAVDRSAWAQIYAATLDGKDLVGQPKFRPICAGTARLRSRRGWVRPKMDTHGPGDGP